MSNYINYKNCPIHFTQQGKGRAVVLLHGFLENTTMWQNLMTHLSEKYRVICIDLLGHGQTGSLGYVHTMAEQAQVVKAVLKHLKLRKVILVGHSMGGYVALAFAKLYADNVKGLCLLNATSLADSKTKKQDRNRAIALVKQNHKSFIKTAIPNLFAASNRITFKSELQGILNQALKTPQQGVIAALEGMKVREDLSYLIEGDTFKTLVFIGEKDTAIQTAPLKKRLEALPNVQMVLLDGGHMGFIENKQEVLTALNRFCRLCFS